MSDGLSGWLAFEGRIEPLLRGDVTYTILRLPEDVAEALDAARAKRVEGEIGDHPVNLAIARDAALSGAFLWTGQSLLDRIGARPGEGVEVRLRPAPDDRVDTPDDLAAALLRGGVIDAWEALSPGKRRGLIYQIGTAKTRGTRDKRIAALIQSLTESP